MGVTHSSNTKSRSSEKEEDLSVVALRETQCDDQVWLGVPEENLFNESFTNEKYYLLHSREEEEDRGNRERQRSSLESTISNRKRLNSATTSAHAESVVGIVAEEDAMVLHSSTVSK